MALVHRFFSRGYVLDAFAFRNPREHTNKLEIQGRLDCSYDIISVDSEADVVVVW